MNKPSEEAPAKQGMQLSLPVLLALIILPFSLGVLGSVYGKDLFNLLTPSHKGSEKLAFSELSDGQMKYICSERLKQIALYDVELLSSDVSRTRSLGALVTGELKLQNGFGAWKTQNYRCTFAAPYDLYVMLDGKLQGNYNRLVD